MTVKLSDLFSLWVFEALEKDGKGSYAVHKVEIPYAESPAGSTRLLGDSTPDFQPHPSHHDLDTGTLRLIKSGPVSANPGAATSTPRGSRQSCPCPSPRSVQHHTSMRTYLPAHHIHTFLRVHIPLHYITLYFSAFTLPLHYIMHYFIRLDSFFYEFVKLARDIWYHNLSKHVMPRLRYEVWCSVTVV